MRQTTPILSRSVLTPALTCLLLLAVACGEPSASATNGDDDGTAPLASALDGAAVLLLRDSSNCGSSASPPLVAELGSGVEFSPDQTGAMEPPCDDGPRPEVEVDIENGSIVFDFSNVGRAGAFPNVRFDGYVIQFARRCGDPVVTSAAVDGRSSEIAISASALSTHYDRVKVNFARVAYDQRTFMKIDLEWAKVDCLNDVSN